MTARTAARIVLALLSLAGIGARLAAQLPEWTSRPASPSAQVKLEESLAYVIDGNLVRAYSAITHAWTAIFTATTPVITLANESFLVKDGALFWGYSPHTGAFAAQYTFSPAVAVIPNASPQTWHNVVIDGNDLHVFFALSGRWQSYSFASQPSVTIGRFCLLVEDGIDVYGISSYDESLIRLGVPGATVMGAEGNVGFVHDAGILYCFSAARNAWSKMTVVATPTITTGNVQNGFVAINDGAAISFFSGHTGTFTTLPASPTATVHLQRQAAVVVDGLDVYGYSGLKGGYASLTLGAAPNVFVDQYHAIVEEPGFGLWGYSAVTNAFSAPLVGNFQVATQAWLATATPAGWTTPSDFYSALGNVWVMSPAAVGANAPTHVSALSVAIEDPGGGLWGWSARGTNWVFEALPAGATVTVGTNPPKTAGTILARSGTTVSAFNAKSEAWRQTTITGAPAYVRGHTSVIVVVDGASAHAFSNLTDEWASAPVGPTLVSQGAQVHAGFVFDGAQVHAYSGLGQVSTWGDFPDHWRNVTQGQRFGLEVAAEGGAETYLFFALASAAVPTPWGTFFLDPVQAVQAAHFLMPAGGVATFTFQVPILPPGALGVPVHWQAAVLGPTGTYLTNAATAIIL